MTDQTAGRKLAPQHHVVTITTDYDPGASYTISSSFSLKFYIGNVTMSSFRSRDVVSRDVYYYIVVL